jgi:hypothetical protein
MIAKKNNIIHNILYNTKLNLRPSKVCDGVGLFALCEIKKDEQILSDISSDNIYIKWDEISEVDENVKNYLKNIANGNENGIYLSRTPNNINLAYFVNHSIEPNVFHNLKSDTFHAVKDIKVDEEILCTYTKDEIDWE